MKGKDFFQQNNRYKIYLQTDGICSKDDIDKTIADWNKELSDNLDIVDKHVPKVSCTLNRNTVKTVYKGQSSEPGNVTFMSSCPLYTG